MGERSLRILQVSTSDLQGGAERVAWSLFTAYRSRGHHSKMAVGNKRSDDPDVHQIPNEEARNRWIHFLRRLSRQLQKGNRKTPLSRLTGIMAEPLRRLDYFRGVEDFHFPGTARLLELEASLPDILHFHNLHGAYFDLRMLSRFSHRLPLLVTLHDAWLLSGHCAHSFDCERWIIGCGHCPDLQIYPAIERDATAYNWRRKHSIYARSKLYLATPSYWLMQKVEKSMLAPAIQEARVIPNGVDLKVFHPTDRLEVRSTLNIPHGARVLLTAGIDIRRSVWRDFQMLREVVASIAKQFGEENLVLILLGEETIPDGFGRAMIRSIPFRPKAEDVALYFQAADIYLHPARVDTFPNTVLEALACGTPVIATSVGGIPEQIIDAQTGYLVPHADVRGMADRLLTLLQDPDLLRHMQREAAKVARQRFDLEKQVDAYLEWYYELAVQNFRVKTEHATLNQSQMSMAK